MQKKKAFVSVFEYKNRKIKFYHCDDWWDFANWKRKKNKIIWKLTTETKQKK